MRINELRKLVNETVRQEQRRTRKPRSNFNKLVEGTVKQVLNEEASPPAGGDELDKWKQAFPKKLDDVDAETAKHLTTSGDGSSEKFGFKDIGDGIACQKLFPSQSSMNYEKAIRFAFGHIKSESPGGNLGAYISADYFIMDGHHRWISSAMVDPDSKIKGAWIDFPGEALVAVLNALTKGRGFAQKGKSGTGSFAPFKDAAKLSTYIQELMEKGSGEAESKDKETGEMKPNEFFIDAQGIIDLSKKFTGSQEEDKQKLADAVAAKFVTNASKLTLASPSWAPLRPQMPVIEKENQKEAQKALRDGEIDVIDPTPIEESTVLRWHKLAGLLKD